MTYERSPPTSRDRETSNYPFREPHIACRSITPVSIRAVPFCLGERLRQLLGEQGVLRSAELQLSPSANTWQYPEISKIRMSATARSVFVIAIHPFPTSPIAENRVKGGPIDNEHFHNKRHPSRAILWSLGPDLSDAGVIDNKHMSLFVALEQTFGTAASGSTVSSKLTWASKE